jgi:RNA polymerase sigma-70 factor (ECF subfamily)
MDTGLLPHDPELVLAVSTLSPEDQMTQTELRAVLEAAIDALPDAYRTVFVLRCVEELSAAETAECLEITEDAVKMRLHRARAMLRQFLFDQSGLAITDLFGFHLFRCDRVVAGVLKRIVPSH